MSLLKNLQIILNELIDFIEEYRGLLDTNHVQFLVDNHWYTDTILNKNLRNDLENFLQNTDKSTPANLIKYFYHSERNNLYPSLNCLFDRVENFFKRWNKDVCTEQGDLLKTNQSELLDFNQMVNEKFAKVQKQNRFMNLKKQYEVDHMSKFVGTLCRKHEIFTIVDIGSGRAYLSSQLSSSLFDDKFDVIAIDSSQSNVESSLKRVDAMKRKTLVFTEKSENVESSRKLLCNVACCYNLLNEKYSKDMLGSHDFKKTNIKLDDSSKFPMSFYLNSKEYCLSYNLRMLACHSLYRCFDSIENFKELDNATLWYRTVLQLILYENYYADFPNENKSSEINLQVGRKMLDFNLMPLFKDYVRKVFNKFNLDNNKLTDKQIDGYMNDYQKMKTPIIEYID
ncbi:methyltransferase 25 [Brachionus plicatilis]|uniref:Methyltransferase 25 n=1 Tax=Brachionus plicatilis TaxID=10195 RepID=A0A3M7SML7_BRAPC|nr:methyltransferase 25 [Brachionus plicatilis]